MLTTLIKEVLHISIYVTLPERGVSECHVRVACQEKAPLYLFPFFGMLPLPISCIVSPFFFPHFLHFVFPKAPGQREIDLSSRNEKAFQGICPLRLWMISQDTFVGCHMI